MQSSAFHDDASRPQRVRPAPSASQIRWHLKKAGRTGLTLASLVWRSPGRLGISSRAPHVRALTYHRFGDAARDPFCVDPRAFEAQMRWLAHNERVVSMRDIEQFVAGSRPLPDESILVTIDDGCKSLYAVALPVLRDYAIPAVAFIPAGKIAPREPAAREEGVAEPHLTWPELAALSAAGIHIGSHAVTHRSLGSMSLAEARAEIVESREILEQRLGQSVTAFAYPFGTRADYSIGTAALLAEAGYRSAFTSQHGAVRPGADPFTLPRIKVEGGEPAWMFHHLCSGALDGWRWVDRTLWRLQSRPAAVG
jgi:peptidoglycan/xylan/chitin deacetylase (PgdA/CDA1 family)